MGCDAQTLTSLASVKQELTVVGNGEMRLGCELSALKTIGGGVTVKSNVQLDTLRVPMLTHVGGNVAVQANTLISTISFDTLATVGGDLLVTDSAPTAPEQKRLIVNLPKLANVAGTMRVEDCPGITQLAATSLATVGGPLRYAYNGVDEQSARLNFAMLTSVKGLEMGPDGNKHNELVHHSVVPGCAFPKLAVSETSNTFYVAGDRARIADGALCCTFANTKSAKCV